MPEYDGVRRARQAVQDLRQRGFDVYADYTLDPSRSAVPPRVKPRAGLMERRSRIAQATGIRSAQCRPTVSAQAALAPSQPVGSIPPSGQGRVR
ncbi:hypothetical protein ACFVDH_39365 [Streptomyces sp. NPDC057674]|uniref:hypothetical protein n=1 Tax=Streptomyces sp. NPDC057674 TaxID=3346203 RepID=UPI0036C2E655